MDYMWVGGGVLIRINDDFSVYVERERGDECGTYTQENGEKNVNTFD